MSAPTPELPQDIEFSFRLSVAETNVVLEHLGRGAFADVAPVVSRIYAQIGPQIDEHQRRAALAAIPAVTEARN